MGPKPDRTILRNRRRSGHAAMEMGLVMMPTFALICGFLDIGMALFTWGTLQNAVREGSRFAITYQMNGESSHDVAIKKMVQQFAMNLVKFDDSPPKIFVNYYDRSDLTTPLAGPNSNRPNTVVEVSIQNYPWNRIAPFSGTISQPTYTSTSTPLQLNLYSASIMGGFPVGTNASNFPR